MCICYKEGAFFSCWLYFSTYQLVQAAIFSFKCSIYFFFFFYQLLRGVSQSLNCDCGPMSDYFCFILIEANRLIRIYFVILAGLTSFNHYEIFVYL